MDRPGILKGANLVGVERDGVAFMVAVIGSDMIEEAEKDKQCEERERESRVLRHCRARERERERAFKCESVEGFLFRFWLKKKK